MRAPLARGDSYRQPGAAKAAMAAVLESGRSNAETFETHPAGEGSRSLTAAERCVARRPSHADGARFAGEVAIRRCEREEEGPRGPVGRGWVARVRNARTAPGPAPVPYGTADEPARNHRHRHQASSFLRRA